MKNIASIHKKIRRQRIEVDQVYDYVAFRILTDRAPLLVLAEQPGELAPLFVIGNARIRVPAIVLADDFLDVGGLAGEGGELAADGGGGGGLDRGAVALAADLAALSPLFDAEVALAVLQVALPLLQRPLYRLAVQRQPGRAGEVAVLEGRLDLVAAAQDYARLPDGWDVGGVGDGRQINGGQAPLVVVLALKATDTGRVSDNDTAKFVQLHLARAPRRRPRRRRRRARAPRAP